ncbi:MAG: cyclopropane-fatty-acyl-phospholipid synthase family protein [Candidatus Eremiobacteraeota bacterium]|nr:cyclopropane-fatty-acyl-phospholipid synthase family protein [Candidatus Eremiobacteraeota bacterium]
MVRLPAGVADARPRAVAALRLLFGTAFENRFAIRLWDDTAIGDPVTAPFTLCINSPGALRTAFRPPADLNAGRAFASGALTCDDDVEAAVDAFYGAMSVFPARSYPRLLALLMGLPKEPLPELREAHLRGKPHSLERDRAAIGFHYDNPVSFYRSFLDPELIYSCAYFDDGVATLDAAQESKLDYVLRKLRLRPGERFLDIGCGWGALVLAAARRGARAFGVTLSVEQHAEAQRRIAAEGLEDLARVELRDYRELRAASFEKIASIGMFEHVGRKRFAEYFEAAFGLLAPGGLFLNHAIADTSHGVGGRIGGFIDRFVFPDSELVPVSEPLAVAERAGFEVRDVENLREHYMRTLRYWVRNLEAHRDAAVAAASEQTYRVWRLYMAGSAQGFRAGRLGLFQALLAKPFADGSVDLPATRRDLYGSR